MLAILDAVRGMAPLMLDTVIELIVAVVGWLVAAIYHLPTPPVSVVKPYAVFRVLVVVPSSKVSEPLVLKVILLTPAAPVLSLNVRVRPGIVAVSGKVTVPGRTRESSNVNEVAVETDMSLYSGVRRNWFAPGRFSKRNCLQVRRNCATDDRAVVV